MGTSSGQTGPYSSRLAAVSAARNLLYTSNTSIISVTIVDDNGAVIDTFNRTIYDNGTGSGSGVHLSNTYNATTMATGGYTGD